jgi:signal transduction histidine kinase
MTKPKQSVQSLGASIRSSFLNHPGCRRIYDMPEILLAVEQRQRSVSGNLTRRWAGYIGLTTAVGLAYFLVAELGLGLYGQTNFVSVFWPGFGLSAGVLIALGPRARWQVATGVIVAILVAHLLIGDPRWLGPAFALSDAAEALVTAGLIQHFFGLGFSLGRLRHVLGLLAAAVPGSMASFTVWTIASKLFQTPTEPILTTWQHWFMGDIVGFVTLGPFVIGLFAAVRQPPPRNELIEGIAALAALAVMTGTIIFLPQEFWQTLMPVAWLFPMLFWIAARCRPVFAAAGACLVSITVVWTTVFGIGHFGNPGLPVDDRNLQAQITILVAALGACVLAALFAERRESEARLARSNVMLAHERDNKLMNAQAITAAIAHEVRQPLAAIVVNGNAALRFLGKTPPNNEEVQAALNRIVGEGHRTSEVFDGIRALFQKVDQGRQPIGVNEIIRVVLQLLRGELNDHSVTTRLELAELPLIDGNRNQLQQVILNLVGNAIEAMNTITDRSRELRVRTELRGRDAISVAVEDSGLGIDPKQLDGIFAAFVTGKSHGMGLGLAICRMIIERHGGQLTASSDGKNGALFQFILPIGSTDKATARPN